MAIVFSGEEIEMPYLILCDADGCKTAVNVEGSYHSGNKLVGWAEVCCRLSEPYNKTSRSTDDGPDKVSGTVLINYGVEYSYELPTKQLSEMEERLRAISEEAESNIPQRVVERKVYLCPACAPALPKLREP